MNINIEAGWKLVPIEPTDAMQAAGAQSIRIDTTSINKIWTGNKVYRAMIAASPVSLAAPELSDEEILTLAENHCVLVDYAAFECKYDNKSETLAFARALLSKAKS